MTARPRWTLWWALLAVGCACRGKAVLTFDRGTYDFGTVVTGTQATQQLTLTNTGTSTVALQTLTTTAGDGQQVFEVTLTPQSLAPGQSATLTAVFHAPTLGGQPFKDHGATVVLQGDTADATFALKGRSIAPQCAVPTSLDFGGVLVGGSNRLHFSLSNPLAAAATAHVGAVVGDPSFTLATDSVSGDVALGPNDSREVAVVFAPTMLGAAHAVLSVRAADGCPDAVVGLQGAGVWQVLTCRPDPVDFGFAAPGGQAVRRTLTIANAQSVPVTLSQLTPLAGTSLSTEFSIVGADSVVLPAGGEASLELDFRAGQSGPRTASLVAQTDSLQQPTVACQLVGAGGSQHLVVEPAGSLDFGQVPWFAGTTSYFVERQLTLRNVGTDVLHLGNPPDVVITLDAPSQTSLLCVGEFTTACTGRLPGYDPAVGLLPGQRLSVPVRVTPGSADEALAWRVVFFSDDPENPSVAVSVQANTVAVPPCQYTVSPGMLSFGRVAAPLGRDLAFLIHNLSTDAGQSCLITTLDLLPGSSDVFSVLDPPLLPVTLAPDQALQVTVRAAPGDSALSGPQYVSGAVQVGLSSPTAPNPNVPLAATVAPGCLSIAPATLDFAAVVPGCGSGQRHLSVFNTCATALTVSSASVEGSFDVDLGGLDAGVVAPLGSVQLTAAYHPADAGLDVGALRLNLGPFEEVVPLTGRGGALTTDTFTVPEAKADLLLALDTSGASADLPARIASQLGGLLVRASDAGIDVHLAVLSSDWDGGLLGLPEVLTSASPNLGALYAQRLDAGSAGDSHPQFASTVTRALDRPIMGFLRPEATLDVLAVSASRDWSPAPAALYAGQLRALKQRPTQLGYHVVGPFAGAAAAGCGYSPLDFDPTLHLQLSSALGGLTREVCSSDWSPLVDQLLRRARGDDGRFALTAAPDLSGVNTLTVTVDGQPVAPAGWTFDGPSQTLTLTVPPKAGARVKVSYAVPCQ